MLSALKVLFSRNKDKTVSKPPGVKQIGKKETVYLPLKIPQNIKDCIVEYWGWQKAANDNCGEYNSKKWKKWRNAGTPSYFHKTKNQICQELFNAVKRWHLYASCEVVAGLIIINTKVGVTIFSNNNYKEFPYCQTTNGWDELDGKAEPLNEKILESGRCYKYVRE